ncbi:Hypothetical protein SRAE_2000424000 [Strongyloides ratti]|uniref:7TM GPCR, serpentine receptor class e (Sre) family-containing protein n=1 Tax=Strongyloides ratti TaxID=34506 RepID=A0A090LIE9_STRRB|nr:Hypothetical protein SRAE_2000424000 [Strongyloides ratti]CEF69592.1 Hypothetical protein SRAE_2000424000 [Strongyloides ratti]
MQNEKAYIIGWLTLLTSIPVLVIQVITTTILCYKIDLIIKNVAYLLITINGFIFFIQQIIHLVSSIFYCILNLIFLSEIKYPIISMLKRNHLVKSPIKPSIKCTRVIFN